MASNNTAVLLYLASWFARRKEHHVRGVLLTLLASAAAGAGGYLGGHLTEARKVAHYAQVTGYGFDHASHFKYHEDECVAEAVKWLEKRKSDKPLCLLVGTNWPHVPWPKTATVTAKSVPPTLVDTPETREARGRYLTAVADAMRASLAVGNITEKIRSVHPTSTLPFSSSVIIPPTTE